MIFTRLSTLAAYLALILGLVHIALGILVANGTLPDTALSRYVGRGTTGEIIEEGFYKILFAIVVGTIAEISNSVRGK